MKRVLTHYGCALLLAFFTFSCSSDDDHGNDGAGNSPGAAANGSGGSASGFGNGGSFNGGGSGNDGSGGAGDQCSADFATTELQPVKLAVAFDVSGSMGKGDYWYHNKALKWDPVVAATKAFFADTQSAGVSASLTFFPASEDKCDAEAYLEPDVTSTELPSQVFADKIDAVTPQSTSEWRGGTPTLAVVDGILQRILPEAAADPGSKYALVLITDGYPQGCDEGVDNIDVVQQAVAEVAATIPTYVIGVANPTTEPPEGEEPAPNTVDNLHAIAASGGTSTAYLIGTGDPEQTARDFRAAVDQIRMRSVACTAEIPPPPEGQTFDPERVNVTYTSQGAPSALGYDASCEAEKAWKFDDAENPKVIELCPSTCALVQADPSSALNVEFGCQRRPPPVE